MVRLIEERVSTPTLPPRVYESLLAIHQAQENSMAQSKRSPHRDEPRLLRLSCAKGGTSVLADACLSHGFLSDAEARFAFDWGVLLQLGDDLQDVQDDLKHGAATIVFSSSPPPDSRSTISCGSSSPSANTSPIRLTSCRTETPRSNAAAHELAVPDPDGRGSLARFTRAISCRIRARISIPISASCAARHKRLAGRRGLYKILFESFLDSSDADLSRNLPRPEDWLALALGPDCPDRIKKAWAHWPRAVGRCSEACSAQRIRIQRQSSFSSPSLSLRYSRIISPEQSLTGSNG